MRKSEEGNLVKSLLGNLAVFASDNFKGVKIIAWRSNTGGMRTPSGGWIAFGVPGMADISGIVSINGRAFPLFIEAKSTQVRKPLTPQDRDSGLSSDQKAFRNMCFTMGAWWFVVSDRGECFDLLEKEIRREIENEQ